MYGESFELLPEAESADYVIPIGKAHVQREGSDITIVTFGRGVGLSMAAAEELAGEGVEAEVINLRTIRPMDTETVIKSLAKTGNVVTVEEGYIQSGVGAEICARIMEGPCAARMPHVCSSLLMFFLVRSVRNVGLQADVSAEGFDYLDAPVERISSADVPMPYSKVLEDYAMVQPFNIVNVVKRVLNI